MRDAFELSSARMFADSARPGQRHHQACRYQEEDCGDPPPALLARAVAHFAPHVVLAADHLVVRLLEGRDAPHLLLVEGRALPAAVGLALAELARLLPVALRERGGLDGDL